MALTSGFRALHGILPHQLWRSKFDQPHKRGLLVSRRSRTGSDWSLAQKACQFVYDAENVRHTIEQGYVILEDENNVVAAFTIGEVMRALRGAQVNPGSMWGDYFYVDQDLQVKAPGDFQSENLM
jgi:hypothetical protein